MKAKALLALAGYEIQDDFEVHDIQTDSRLIQPGDIFIALNGAHANGHDYIPQALARGAKLVLTQNDLKDERFVVMTDANKTLSKLAYYFYGEPTKNMTVIGVTGTNGKTTTTTLLYQALTRLKVRCGLIGTNGLYYPEGQIPLNNTTPDALLLMRYFKMFQEKDIHTVIMEVSSHALALGRVDFINYHIAVFTNLSQDHLDFHRDMQDYLQTKSMLFSDLGEDDFAVLNADIPEYETLKKRTSAKVISYGVNHGDLKAENIVMNMAETSFDLDHTHVSSDLLSLANVYNLLAVAAVLKALGYEDYRILSQLKHIDGRLEKVYQGDFLAIVDYAHSPDSIRNALTFLGDIKQGRLISVVGCGGDRDKSKRPAMAQTACALSDFVILTSDNPRTEDPEAILADMVAGLRFENNCVIVNRREAIVKAVQMARKGDIIAVLGKGHEDYQIIGVTKHHFSDREEILKAVKGESL